MFWLHYFILFSTNLQSCAFFFPPHKDCFQTIKLKQYQVWHIMQLGLITAKCFRYLRLRCIIFFIAYSYWKKLNWFSVFWSFVFSYDGFTTCEFKCYNNDLDEWKLMNSPISFLKLAIWVLYTAHWSFPISRLPQQKTHKTYPQLAALYWVCKGHSTVPICESLTLCDPHSCLHSDKSKKTRSSMTGQCKTDYHFKKTLY